MFEKYGDKAEEWPDFDAKVWFKASGGKKNGYYYGVPALMDSENLGRPKNPVMGNILESGEVYYYHDFYIIFFYLHSITT